jgi:hypothetical protein
VQCEAQPEQDQDYQQGQQDYSHCAAHLSSAGGIQYCPGLPCPNLKDARPWWQMSASTRDRRVVRLAAKCGHTLPVCGKLRGMSVRSSVPGLLWWLFWFLVAILLIILAALVVHHFGGFDLSFHVGYFHFLLGVTG